MSEQTPKEPTVEFSITSEWIKEVKRDLAKIELELQRAEKEKQEEIEELQSQQEWVATMNEITEEEGFEKVADNKEMFEKAIQNTQNFIAILKHYKTENEELIADYEKLGKTYTEMLKKFEPRGPQDINWGARRSKIRDSFEEDSERKGGFSW